MPDALQTELSRCLPTFSAKSGASQKTHTVLPSAFIWVHDGHFRLAGSVEGGGVL